MARVYYNKLVRDNIKEKLEVKKVAYEMRTLTDEVEFQQELFKKIQEEALALARVRSREEFLAEYADLMVALDTLTHKLELTEADIRVALEENVARKGLYKQQQYLHWSDDDDYVSNESPQGIKQ